MRSPVPKLKNTAETQRAQRKIQMPRLLTIKNSKIMNPESAFRNPKCNCLFAFVVSILISCCVLPGLAAASPEQPARQENLVLEYSEEMGFAKHQVLDASINHSVLKLSINECSFCGAFKDDKKRSDIAHKTLDWFLEKTGQKEGTVEWYNKSRQKIMVITGSSAQAEITTGPSCDIQNKQTQ